MKLILLGETADCRLERSDRESLWSSFISTKTFMRGTVTDIGAGMENRRISELPGADYMADGTKLSVSPRGIPDFCRATAEL